jgi:hypothetical protein
MRKLTHKAEVEIDDFRTHLAAILKEIHPSYYAEIVTWIKRAIAEGEARPSSRMQRTRSERTGKIRLVPSPTKLKR